MAQPSPKADDLRRLREARYERLKDAGRLRRQSMAEPNKKEVREIVNRAMKATSDRAIESGEAKLAKRKARKKKRRAKK